jgi:8-oxo-dGTP pyrophosphatase MutT (NUDIX family)
MKERLRASTVCEAEGKLLLVRMRDPVSGASALYPPGGAIEPNETPADAAARETLEETGVEVVVDPTLVLVERYPFVWAGEDVDVTTHYFMATTETSSREPLPPVKDAEYVLGALWVPTIRALDELSVHPAIGSAVARLLRRKHLPAWRAHANAGGPASMLLAIHDQFRRAAEYIATLEDPKSIARAFRPLGTVLHHHHHAEEVMLFPLVEQRTKVEPERLVRDHAALTTAIASVNDTPSKETIARFATVLCNHLDREELEVMPVLLELTPEQAFAMLH